MEELIKKLKYAKSSEMTIQLLESNHQITLMIEDDGIGFSQAEMKTGIGLLNMESRVNDLNGEFSIDSLNNSGTSIIILLPKLEKLI